MVDVPSQLFTTESIGAAGVVFGAGVTELLDPLVQSPAVTVAVTAVVVVTVIGLPLPPLLQAVDPLIIRLPSPSLAVMVDVPPQLSVTVSIGAAGAVFGAGVTALLASLVQPFTVRVAVTEVVALTVIGLPLPPLLHVNSVPGIRTSLAS